MEILGDLSFLSKYKLHLVIDNNNINITVNGNSKDFEELKKHFDELELMKNYENFGIKFDKAQLTNRTLNKNIYGEQFHACLTLKPKS